jgi:tRNA G37 N-methylase Trm5
MQVGNSVSSEIWTKVKVDKGAQEIIFLRCKGIGYYTLPALIHGRASFVYACEWNVHAANALEYNASDNMVADRVQILVGDCREQAKLHNIVNLVDRVSLGLLPSNEGGWRTAIRALKECTGGWLHVHGNVPVKEAQSWALWVCSRLGALSNEEGKPGNWVFLCNHVERVKSFAPTICHYVADIFVGPPEGHIQGDKLFRNSLSKAGMMLSNGNILLCPDNIDPPSCALSPHGALSQEWMR